MLEPAVAFGEIMLRLSPPGFERLLQTPMLCATSGGAEANVAVALASLGRVVCENLPRRASGVAFRP